MTTTELPPAPDSIRELSAITDPDYADTYTLTADDVTRWPVEEWARTCFDELAGFKAWLMWRFVLGLKLAWRKSPDTVCGWRIGARGPDWIRLEAEGRRLRGNLVYRVTEGRAQLATIAEFKHPKMVRKWKKLQPTHNSIVPGLVDGTHEALRSKSDRP